MFDELRRYAELHTDDRCKRAWGFSIVLTPDHDRGAKQQIREKLLILNAGCGIALEQHLGYSELWIPETSVRYALENSDGRLESYSAKPYRAVVIPRGCKHKLHNPGAKPAYIYEVQTGVITDGDKVVFADDDVDLTRGA